MKQIYSLRSLKLRSRLRKSMFSVEQRIDKTGKIFYLVVLDDEYICFEHLRSVMDYLKIEFPV